MRTQRTHGFTFVEVMVSVGILLAGVVAAIGATVSLVALTNAGSLLTIGSNDAQHEMEQIRALPFASVASYNETRTNLPNETVSVVSSTLGTTLKQITVTVSWREAGTTKTYVLSTLRAE